MYVYLRTFKFFEFFFHVIYPFRLSVMFFLFPYLNPKLFCFFCILFLICLRAFSTILSVEFSFVILKGPVLLVLLNLVPVSFMFPLFPSYFLDYFLQLYRQICVGPSYNENFRGRRKKIKNKKKKQSESQRERPADLWMTCGSTSHEWMTTVIKND